MAEKREYVLQMEHISKKYAENQVLKDVSLHIRPGEIHALMGENGAGKSTLMNILFGMPVIHTTGGFEGTVQVDGETVNIDTPLKAMELGIGMVHQEFMLIPGFTVTENIKIGREISHPNLISRLVGSSMETLDLDAMARDARKALTTIGLKIGENAYVRGLPVGYMQFIEIAREIDKRGIRLLVFDEPTAVLTESEADREGETQAVDKDFSLQMTDSYTFTDPQDIDFDQRFVLKGDESCKLLSDMANMGYPATANYDIVYANDGEFIQMAVQVHQSGGGDWYVADQIMQRAFRTAMVPSQDILVGAFYMDRAGTVYMKDEVAIPEGEILRTDW